MDKITMSQNKAGFSAKDKCVHEIFSEQAKLNPEKIAVKLNDSQITYGELNKKVRSISFISRL